MRWQGEFKGAEVERRPVKKELASGVNPMAVLVFSVVSFVWSMLIWSQSFTGRVVFDGEVLRVNVLGIVLFVFSVLGFFVYVRRRGRYFR